MNFPKLREAQERLAAKRKELKVALDEARTESGDYDPKKVTSVDLSDGTDFYEWVTARNKEIEEAKGEVDQRLGEKREMEAALEHAADADPGHLEQDGQPSGGARRPASIGQAFIESDAFKLYGGGGQGPTAKIDLDVRAALFERSDGWEPETTRTGIVTLQPQRRAPHVVDFINVIPTGQAAVKYMEETVFINPAAERGEGQQFPEASLKLEERQVVVQKVPVWLPVTDEQLEDEPGARLFVETRLGFMLRQRVDRQVIRGNGVAPNLLGTENVQGIQTQAKSSDDLIDALYKLFVKVMGDHEEGGGDADPNVVFIRASKWQEVVLMRSTDGIYLFGNPATGGPSTAWGVPAVQTNTVTASKAVTGDYLNHAFVAPRRDVDIQITNAHSDFFTSGKQAIRADVRLAMVHLRPAAFGELTGL